MEEKQERKGAGWLKRGIMAECVLVLLVMAVMLGKQERAAAESTAGSHVLSIENDYIKWVDFTVSYEALCKAYDWDVETHGSEHEIDWVELLAYTAARTGGEFGADALKAMEKAAKKLSEGDSTMEELTEDLKYYPYYKEAYEAAIGGLVGEYWEEDREAGGSAVQKNVTNEGLQGESIAGGQEANGSDSAGQGENDGTKQDAVEIGRDDAENGRYVKRYGLKGYFPLARGFDYTHYDDFGVGRSYGYQRKHLGSYVIIVSS